MKRFILLSLAAVGLFFSACTPEDAITTTHYCTAERYYLTDAHQDSLEIDITFTYLVDYKDTAILHRIQKDLKHRLFGEAYIDMEPQAALDAYIAMLKTEYKNNYLPIKEEWNSINSEDDFNPTCCEQQVLSGYFESGTERILSYCVERYVYTGGAHGNNFRQFVNYDLTTGNQLTEDSVFAADFKEPLTNLLLEYLVKQHDDIELIQDLQEAGYNVDDIRPNDNFYFAEEGLTYVFNPYDIAPYAYGETEILLPWEAVNPILRSEFQKID